MFPQLRLTPFQVECLKSHIIAHRIVRWTMVRWCESSISDEMNACKNPNSQDLEENVRLDIVDTGYGDTWGPYVLGPLLASSYMLHQLDLTECLR